MRPRAIEVTVAEQALRACGYEPTHIMTGGALGRQRLPRGRLPVHQPGRRDRAQPRADRADQHRRARGDARGRDRAGRRGRDGAGRGGFVSVEFELIGAEVEWEGAIVRAGTERFRYPDGAEVTRDKVWHPGAVGIVALDDEHVWLTRQPREVIGDDRLARDPRRQARRPGRAADRDRQARAGRGDRQARRALGGAAGLLHQPRVQRRAPVAVSGDRARGRSARRGGRGRADRDRAVAARSPRRGDRAVRGLASR